jgi:hypothetical protein
MYPQTYVVISLLVFLSEPLLPHDRPAGALKFPDPTKVDRIIVSRQASAGEEKVATFTDSKKIGELLAFMRVRNDMWYTPWYTFPGPQYTIQLQNKKELIVVLWVGTGWLGGRQGDQGSSENRLRTLTDKDRTELLKLLGVGKR